MSRRDSEQWTDVHLAEICTATKTLLPRRRTDELKALRARYREAAQSAAR